jgi:hypothetical protein
VAVLLGNRDGTFQPAQAFGAGPNPQSVAVADFDSDGILDLAIANNVDPNGTVSILTGNGDGTFQAVRSFAAGAAPVFVTVADLNGDGRPDLALANDSPGSYFRGNPVNVLLGNGDGTFQAAQPYTAGPSPQAVAAADFNGDGIPDLVVANGGDYFGLFKGVSILLGMGDGTFQPAQNYTVDTGSPASVAVKDFNGDGILDLAVADADSSSSPGRVNILLGNGDGTFRAGQSYSVGSSPQAVAVGEFNGDGHSDLAVTNTIFGTVSLLLGKGDGTFRAAINYAAGGQIPYTGVVSSVAVRDFNRDGVPDLVVVNYYSVSVMLANGDGTFQMPHTYAQPGSGSVAVGDFDGDGILDLAVTGESNQSSTVSILLGNGDGTFRQGAIFANGTRLGVNAIAVGDFNGDGKADIVTTNFAYIIPTRGIPGGVTESDVRVFLSNGDGTFQAAQIYSVPEGNPIFATVGDFNGDGVPDLVVADGGNAWFPGTTVSILLGKGDGSFQGARSYPVGNMPRSVAVGDINGDGIPDLVVAAYGYPSGTVNILLGNGDGTFGASQSYTVGYDPARVVLVDFNGDGKLDLAVAHVNGNGTVSIALGNGDGTFQAAQDYAFGWGLGDLGVGDFNGDGYPDLAVPGYGDPGNVTILLNDASWQG